MISVAIKITWRRGGGGGGWLSKICSGGTTKLMVTGYRYPDHKHTLQTLFSYLPQKILARIVGDLL